MQISFTKVHGSNNQFFLLDERSLPTPLTDDQLQLLAQKVCDRTHGLAGGADGILLVTKATTAATARMRVINADGSEASMCGNGLRTVARHLSETEGLTDFTVQTMYADLHVAKHEDFAPDVPAFAVEISPVSFAAKDLGMHVGTDEVIDQPLPQIAADLHFSAVAVPNPHLIAFVDEATAKSELLGKIGRHLNDGQNPYFPDGVNVSFVWVKGDHHIFVRTFERGVGYTNACGTAMSASSLMAVLLHQANAHFEETLTVQNPGGMVKTVPHKQGDRLWIDLIGNATEMGTYRLDLTTALAGDFGAVTATVNDREIAAYTNFVATLA